MFDSIRPSKASLQIISQIRKQIFEGKLRPGDTLPPESKLMKQFNVSKQTLREALRALEFIGLIEINKGIIGGAKIVEMDSQIAIGLMANFLYFKKLSIHHLTDMRRVIESYAAGVAAESMSEHEKDKLKNLIDSSKKDHDSNGLSPQIYYSDLNFHCEIAKSTKNPLLILIVDLIESVMVDEKTGLIPDKEMNDSIVKGHEQIYQAIVERNSQKARMEMSNHINEVEAFMLKFRKNNTWIMK